jgi:hypothetical protein
MYAIDWRIRNDEHEKAMKSTIGGKGGVEKELLDEKAAVHALERVVDPYMDLGRHGGRRRSCTLPLRRPLR